MLNVVGVVVWMLFLGSVHAQGKLKSPNAPSPEASESATRTSEQGPSSGRSCLTLSLCHRSYLDGAPFIQVRYPFKPKWLNTCFSLGFTQQLGIRNAIHISVSNSRAIYYVDDSYPSEPGDVTERNGLLLELSFYRLLTVAKDWHAYAMLGASYRRGSEFVFRYRYLNELNVSWYNLRDPGIHLGLFVKRPLFWRLNLDLQLKFTQFFLRFDDGTVHGEHYVNRSTRNMLSIDTGLGFNF